MLVHYINYDAIITVYSGYYAYLKFDTLFLFFYASSPYYTGANAKTKQKVIFHVVPDYTHHVLCKQNFVSYENENTIKTVKRIGTSKNWKQTTS